MIDIIKDTLLDVLKLLPFLFVAFFIIEYIEHKFSEKSKNIIVKSNKFGPFFGSLLGIFPQCGFSALASNLYTTRIISLGTLISIYLSTSDEMLPILISNRVDIILILEILATKLIIGMIIGFLIDLILRKRKSNEQIEMCEEHEHCEGNIFVSAIKHTLNTTLFLIIIIFVINCIMEYYGINFLSKILLKDNLFGPFITSLIGLIPNCAASVILTELYLNSAISFASLISGLLTGSGIGLLVLFKENKNYKENLIILILTYFSGALCGMLIEFISMLFK